MKAIIIAIGGQTRLAARLASELEATGHTVCIADGRDGPLRDAADALLLPAPAPEPLRNAAEWSIVCGAPDPAVHCAHARPLHCEIVADAFPPREVRVAWLTDAAPGDTRVLADATLAFGAALNGADLADEIAACAVDLMHDVASGIARELRDPNDAPRATPPGPADIVLDLERLAGWHASNDTAAEWPCEPSLPELVSRAAAAAPDACALVAADGQLTYRELVTRARQVAARIAARPTAPRVVAVRLDKGVALYPALVGVLGAGATCVPLDPAFPPERARTILRESGAQALVVDGVVEPALLDGFDLDVIDCGAHAKADADASPNALSGQWPLERDADRAARCAVAIYTSGSTGVPKGVMLSHRNIVQFCHWYRAHVSLDASSRVLQFSTVAFDASLLDMFPTWLAGATLVAPSEAQRRELDALAALVADARITHAFLPPALLAALPDCDWPALAHLVTGGDVCDPDTIARWSANRRLHNIYGPTECTVLATTGELRAGDSNRRIGRPIANARCHVLAADGRPALTGEEGELCIAGAGVGLGYLGRPDLSAERFVADPYGTPGATMYRTGDIASWEPDGTLRYVGRRDAQLKIRGFRVEPGEIETAALAAGLYRQCAVVPDERKRIRLFAAKPVDAAATPDALRAVLAATLPDYMVPYDITALDVLPATPNGKIDRAALARLPVSRAGSDTRDAPRGALELRLAAMWATLLELAPDEIGRDASFFELGGHSLLVSRLMLAVKRELGGNAALARFMERPTIAALAALLTDETGERGANVPARVHDDRRLPDDVRLPAGQSAGDGPGAVLLTGANGFLGSFILSELISRTNQIVYCVVRGDDDASARRRLDEAAFVNGLGHLCGHPRVRVLRGDLGAPRLGLSDAVWQTLAAEVGAIHHNGAHVNHVYDYPYLHAENVGSTLELLRLCCSGRRKALHFVSTLSAASATGPTGRLIEAAPSEAGPAFVNNGYNLTKWVSEHLVAEAAARGIDTTILRPGNITGHSRTGLCQPGRNRILLLLKGAVQLGCAPLASEGGLFDLSPVDYLARAIVACTLDGARTERVFHLHNPRPLDWAGYLRALARRGYPLRFEAPGVWRERLLSIDESNALFDVVAFYLDDRQDDIGDMAVIDHARTEATLRRLGVTYPDKDDALLDAHFGYLAECGFMPPPPEPAPRANDARRDAEPEPAW
ncbi:amino acid adenylation domain-containing protein [Burkholderia cenocepacia]|uniref:amino acid adenylation domain-containing protein n=1 Tax=Burkholderia cenocepacia TaxID=95486 RepID=UPI00285B755F|nr:amino acid adenylation domain-containing protein [Burkholderia cenocepacia]MDR8073009.1 amino acid adenylation domain-containing protein [Burkholderia cenocepacia]